MELPVREPSVLPTVTTEEFATPKNNLLMKLVKIMMPHGMLSSMQDVFVIWGTEDQTAPNKSVHQDLMCFLEREMKQEEIAQGEGSVIMTEVSASASLDTLELDVNIKPSLDR